MSNVPPPSQPTIQQAPAPAPSTFDGGIIAAIVIGTVLGLVLIGLCLWLLSKKKNVKKVGKQGKRYTKGNKASYAECLVNPLNFGKCNKPSYTRTT